MTVTVCPGKMNPITISDSTFNPIWVPVMAKMIPVGRIVAAAIKTANNTAQTGMEKGVKTPTRHMATVQTARKVRYIHSGTSGYAFMSLLWMSSWSSGVSTCFRAAGRRMRGLNLKDPSYSLIATSLLPLNCLAICFPCHNATWLSIADSTRKDEK